MNKFLRVLKILLPVLVLMFGVSLYLNATLTFVNTDRLGVGTSSGGMRVDADGNMYMTGSLDVDTNLNVDGNAVIDGTLTQTGIATFAAIPVFSAGATITGDGTVSGLFTSGGYAGGILVKSDSATITAAEMEDYDMIVSTKTGHAQFTIPASTNVANGTRVTFFQAGGAYTLTLAQDGSTNTINGSASSYTGIDAASDTISVINWQSQNDWVITEAVAN